MWCVLVELMREKVNYFPFLPLLLGYIYETAGYAHMRFEVPLRVYFEQHRMACAAIYHLVELAHENNGLKDVRAMLGVENDRCLLFEDHVKGEVMALMGVDEAEDSARNNPISVER